MILVKPFKADEISAGGIYVPESARQESNKVLIVKVSEGTKDNPMKLKEGDVGFRVKEWGEKIIIENESYYLMEQDAIIALND